MSNDRFLLIKSWSYILWGDVDHVLGQLLVAELTNRIPVVYWPTHCLHNGYILTNGFELYFEPVSNYTIFDVAKPEYTYYPPIWNYENLFIEDQNKDTWIYRNIGDLLSSQENVVVADVYYNIHELIPFIKKNHPAYGMSSHQIYRYLFNKYIKLRSDINMEVQGFYNSWLKGNHPVLAVHVRRAEKDMVFDTRDSKKNGNQYWNKIYKKYKQKPQKKGKKLYRLFAKGKFKEPNRGYHKEIKKYINKYNIKKIFLLTDCEDTLNEYKNIYGSMLVYTNCKRIKNDEPVYHIENPMVVRRRGIEIVKDAYIAAKCDFFIGNDFSNVSHGITRIKDWADKNVKMMYWTFKRRKYPINAMVVVKSDKPSIFTRTAQRVKKLFNRFKKNKESRGELNAK
ncbi:O-fucosyltransferase family protein [Ruminiclostridium josui]|uniref:O-fucosyltransferase family protein n=1 Tax=Ruminiclostridium josui TaxID=1499 RepID=UPI00046536FC|nr:O-fucosyltransferase family protein [Ruminiclostridium josui]